MHQRIGNGIRELGIALWLVLAGAEVRDWVGLGIREWTCG